jgi:hypothetical protein
MWFAGWFTKSTQSSNSSFTSEQRGYERYIRLNPDRSEGAAIVIMSGKWNENSKGTPDAINVVRNGYLD